MVLRYSSYLVSSKVVVSYFFLLAMDMNRCRFFVMLMTTLLCLLIRLKIGAKSTETYVVSEKYIIK